MSGMGIIIFIWWVFRLPIFSNYPVYEWFPIASIPLGMLLGLIFKLLK